MSELRDNSADLLKAIAIISVVWIHSFNLNNSVINLQVIADTLRFCVPSFIILWAFFYERSLNARPPSEYKKYISHRLLTLAAPYFFWSLLHFFLFYDASNISWSTIVNGHFGGYGWAGQFFLVILFQWTIILPFIRRSISWKSTAIITVLCVLFYYWIAYDLWQIKLVKKMGHRLFFYWIPYVFIGIIMAKKGIPQLHPWLVFLCILSVLIIPLEYQTFRVANLDFSPYIMPSVLISSIALSIALLSLQNIDKLPALVSLIGKNTFAIFVLNPFVIRIIAPYIEAFSGKIYIPIVSDVGASVIVLFLCLSIAIILNKIHLGIIVGQH